VRLRIYFVHAKDGPEIPPSRFALPAALTAESCKLKPNALIYGAPTTG
jgi:hypothetical protein